MPTAKKKNARKRAPRNKPSTVNADAIEIRGVWQNNLKGFDIDVPLNKLNVVTGPSGSGKSSFAFQTVYAEGQRRYVETFSPYTRQFFDRMDKPKVDEIRGIPPAIAIEQANHVRSTRSTVGTITEINDYLKLIFPRLASGFCPETGLEVRPETPESITIKAKEIFGAKAALVTFPITAPPKMKVAEFFEFLQQQGYLRVLIFGETYRTDSPDDYDRKKLPANVDVIQDRVSPTKKGRFLEAVEAALDLGKGLVSIVDTDEQKHHRFSRGWHCAESGIELRPPTPGLFSFNHPLGACPDCRGFGRTVAVDLNRAIPVPSQTLKEGAVKAFHGDRNAECQRDLMRFAKLRDVPTNVPFEDLSQEHQDWVMQGENPDPDEAWRNEEWYGVKGFFSWMESRSYKMHVRVFLSRFRSYTLCPSCEGGRLQPESLNYKIEGKTLPDFQRMPVDELLPFVQALALPKDDPTTEMVHGEIMARLEYLGRVGLGYLNLDRSTRTLSGGELQRVNLTTCLGASLVGTLFVLDEPSIGLHPRDTDRLIEVMETLRDKGNTLLVVEHEEAVIRAADNLIDIGPGRGELGGELVFNGPISQLTGDSLTGRYLNGEEEIETPKKRRKAKRGKTIKVVDARQNNLKRVSVSIPLGLFTVVTGVSGSGKSTLINDVLYRNLLRAKGLASEETPGRVKEILGHEKIDEVVMVDQSPLARTPRSTPAVYTKAFDLIRKLFAESSEGKAQGLTMGYFSFNSGGGRCERCSGNGFEKIEMQFLSDLFVRCPECEGKRYRPDTLEVLYAGKSIAEVLEMSVSQAIHFFNEQPEKKAKQVVEKALGVLEEVGLGYLRLGQPLNTLSGGESQRLKLVGHLIEKKKGEHNALLIFDEPTTGLHFDDIAILMKVFHKLVDQGNSIIVIEHNLDVIKNADWVLDLGPDAGTKGGELLAEGPPENLAKHKTSHTGRHLAPLLGESRSLKVAERPNVAYKVNHSKNISVHGAREHNLKDIDVEIPRDKFVVVTGLSGSGKSTLAFDILFAEGQRRFLDSMSPYARQFAEQLEKPDIDHVTGLPPTVAIEQRVSRGGGKSTVATVTEVYHFLRLLYSKLGTQYSPFSQTPVIQQSISSMVTKVRGSAKSGPVKILAPLIKARKGFHTEVAQWAERQGYEKLLVDKQWKDVEGFQKLERFKEHTIDVLVAEITSKTKTRDVQEALETALRIGKGSAKMLDKKNTFHTLSSSMVCPETGVAFEALDPRMFSYNSPHGWCRDCRGYGYVAKKRQRLDASAADSVLDAELQEEMRRARADADEFKTCPTCDGARLNQVSLWVMLGEYSIDSLARMSVIEAREAISSLSFAGDLKIIARDIIPEIEQRLNFMEEVGLGYLTLDRSAKTLSGGEAQRIRLASQLGSNLRGVLYVLDEPTIGLHPRDNVKLLDMLEQLKNKGNSLIVVEHDEETMMRSDHIVDLGPGAGQFGGTVMAQGPLKKIQKNPDSTTGRYLKDPMIHPMLGKRRELPEKTARKGWVKIKGASANNLKGIDIAIPVGRLTCISGISGSGKSSFMRGVLKPALDQELKKEKAKNKAWKQVLGGDQIGAVYEVDQSPIGKTSRSTPATYVKIFDEIRKLFAGLPMARARGYTASRFSFNTEGGRCETCKGNGAIKLEMNFLPTTHVPCEDCGGMRYNAATLEVAYNSKNIGQIMNMSIDEAASFFESNPKIARTLGLLSETGTGYLRLGQASPTLSGGEAQRIKLVTQLTKGVARAENAKLRQNRTVRSHLYLIEEPSIGLHMADVKKLVDVLHRLVDEGHTVVVIEHNLDILAEADYLLDIGPEAGADGGEVVASGTPEEVVRIKESRTGVFLKGVLA